jgi:dihydroorotate dehydrogenase electron transfer subunit
MDQTNEQPRLLLEDAEIMFNRCLDSDLFHMGLRCPRVAGRIQPGQFLMVRIQNALDPLLRRPFAVHRLFQDDPPTRLEILYRVVGRGTRLLSGMPPGKAVNLLGPLGCGFLPPPQEGPVLMVAGGIGIAPLPFLADRLVGSGLGGPFVLWFGAKSAVELVCVEHFQQLGFEVQLATEDGSLGRQGLITEHLEQWLPGWNPPPSVVYSCGPYPMQKRVADLAARLGIPSQLSMEALMACGVGACLSCSLRCRSPEPGQESHYVNVCQQGPVFPGEQIVWD